MHICRRNTDSIPYFRRSDGPKLPEGRVKFGAWLDNITLEIEGDKRTYTLKITDRSEAFTDASNKSLEPTAGRRVTSLFMTKTPSLRATLGLASGDSAPSR